MFRSSFEKVIDSLVARFSAAEHTEVLKPVLVKNERSLNNRLLIVHRGKLTLHTRKGEDIVLHPGKIYFFPAGMNMDVTYGALPIASLVRGEAGDKMDTYLKEGSFKQLSSAAANFFSTIDFSVKAYNAIDLFEFIELPFCEIEATDVMNDLVEDILEEDGEERLGKRQLLDSYITNFIVMLFRYILDRKLFLQDIGFKIDALMDPRLISIFAYAMKNLEADLSNAAIGEQVGLSKDYIGQFFKKMTKMNLQGYIKTIRIHKAVELITSSNLKIQEIAKKVGIPDFAYFCRVFKTIMGSPAKRIQRRARQQSLTNRRA